MAFVPFDLHSRQVGGIGPLEGMPLDTLTRRLTSLGSEKLDVDTIETFVRV